MKASSRASNNLPLIGQRFSTLQGVLVKNKLAWVFVSNFLPLAAGIVAIPLMVGAFGNELFGFLTILWMFIGYFTLFDLGISRALTQSIAQVNAVGDRDEIVKLYSTGMSVVVVAGLVAGLLVYVAAGYISGSVFNINEGLIDTAESSLQVTGLAVVFTVWATGLRGVLEGFEKFKVVSIGRIPLGVWMFIGPLIFFYAFGSFFYAVASLALARFFLFLYYFFCVRRVVSFSYSAFTRYNLVKLLSFGGWMTLSNTVSPVMVYFDRFIIGSMIAMSVVSFYTVPYEMATKLLLVPASIGTVIFPRVSALLHEKNYAEVMRLQRYSYLANFLLIVPVILGIYFLGEFLLDIWVGSEYAENSYIVFMVILFGVLVNSMGSVPYNLLQAAGKAKVTALLHLLEVPVYLAFIVFAIKSDFGLEGVAVVWATRCLFDWIALEFLKKRYVRFDI